MKCLLLLDYVTGRAFAVEMIVDRFGGLLSAMVGVNPLIILFGQGVKSPSMKSPCVSEGKRPVHKTQIKLLLHQVQERILLLKLEIFC